MCAQELAALLPKCLSCLSCGSACMRWQGPAAHAKCTTHACMARFEFQRRLARGARLYARALVGRWHAFALAAETLQRVFNNSQRLARHLAANKPQKPACFGHQACSLLWRPALGITALALCTLHTILTPRALLHFDAWQALHCQG